jgi:hypothetical protein
MHYMMKLAPLFLLAFSVFAADTTVRTGVVPTYAGYFATAQIINTQPEVNAFVVNMAVRVGSTVTIHTKTVKKSPTIPFADTFAIFYVATEAARESVTVQSVTVIPATLHYGGSVETQIN